MLAPAAGVTLEGVPDPLRVLALGAGVQSSTLLLMACEGELEALDVAIFADTGWEPPAVYAWLESTLEPAAQRAGIPLVIVRDKGGPIQERPWEMPLFVEGEEGTFGMLRRTCTSRLKIAPVRREIRRRLVDKPTPGAVEQWLGISWDESERMSDSDVRYITHRYPLIERRLERVDCHNWLARRGLEAPKSACVGCPFRSDAQWLEIKRQPEQWAEVVDLDARLRPNAGGSIRGTAYLHRSRRPIDVAPLKHDAQLDLFAGCGGHCGV